MPTYTNTLLRHLEPDVLRRLCLRERDLPVRHGIEAPGKPITQLLFIESGVASMTVSFQDGDQVEVGMFGFESVSGVPALMGVHKSLNPVYMQLGDRGYSAAIELARGVRPRRPVPDVNTSLCAGAAHRIAPVHRLQRQTRHPPAPRALAAHLRRSRP